MKVELNPNDAPTGERLQKILARAGIASRRAAEAIILEGRVQVNGQTVTELGTRADTTRDHIRVDGKLLHGPEPTKYFMVNKPRGYVTTLDDPEHRPTVMQLLGQEKQKKIVGEHSKFPRLYPVGRLDYLSEGLLLMTNDGELANKLSKAATGVLKTYLVKVSGSPTDAAIDQLRRGIMIDRGRLADTRSTGRRDRVLTQPAKWSKSAAATILGTKSPSPRAATASSARCSKRSATTSKKSAASATGH